jgi:hypothetical protein
MQLAVYAAVALALWYFRAWAGELFTVAMFGIVIIHLI